jgi:hypothetical protein
MRVGLERTAREKIHEISRAIIFLDNAYLVALIYLLDGAVGRALNSAVRVSVLLGEFV